MDSKLWDITGSLLLNRFKDINDKNKWGWVGTYRRFRSHALRKFHASNLGLGRDIVDLLQGRSKDEIQEAYFKQDPKQLKKIYMDYMKNILIYDNFGWGGSLEDIERIKENNSKAHISDTGDGIVDLTAQISTPNSVMRVDNTMGQLLIEHQEKKQEDNFSQYDVHNNYNNSNISSDGGNLLNTNVADELLKYAQLMDMNLISREEFNMVKIKLLGGLLNG